VPPLTPEIDPLVHPGLGPPEGSAAHVQHQHARRRPQPGVRDHRSHPRHWAQCRAVDRRRTHGRGAPPAAALGREHQHVPMPGPMPAETLPAVAVRSPRRAGCAAPRAAR
jgi:hypothetical protein